MTIVDFDPLPALVGGAMIGLSAALVLLLNGKVAGISGIFGRIFNQGEQHRAWRVCFVLGLVAGGAIVTGLLPEFDVFELHAGTPLVLAAGLLVGFGTRLGGGCTSGHGVCGISRGAKDSILATLTFMGAGAVTVYVFHHLLGGGGLS